MHLFPIVVCFEFGTFILVADMLLGSYQEIHTHTYAHMHTRTNGPWGEW